ncbi:MAG: MurR/RpiR family transcriptional regulator [Acidobacteriaceae bacterium]|nr:MurR/RpiR family transcriptional regulator [Acidobacteriaceae bacterium]MBV9782057.1 MurR/RpiR family transcriptional regulator [Acidobacteriaceae bacterium]
MSGETHRIIRDSTPTELETRFADAQSKLNGSRRNLIRSILEHPEDNYFLSSRELAKRYNVNAATIVRTIQALGYNRFGDFATDLRNHFVTRITPYTVMRATTRDRRLLTDRIRRNIERDLENLTALLAGLDTPRVLLVAKQIQKARRIIVVGVDFAAFLAGILAYALRVQGCDADAPEGSSGNLRHHVDLLGEKDLLIAISFGRCLRDTVESVRHARSRGTFTFGITDSDITPIARFCDQHIVASISSVVFTGSYVAPLAAVNAIISAVAHIHPKRTLERLRRNEQEYTSGARWYQNEDGSRNRFLGRNRGSKDT